jgi:hypothetical protein
MKLSDYCVIVGQDTDVLEQMVRSAMESGWELSGGVSVWNDGDRTRYAQAMVKHEEETAPKKESTKKAKP